MTASKTKVISINLDNSDHNSAISVGELIQQACYDKLKDKIQREIEKTKKDDRYHNGAHHGEYPPGSGLVYFIDGTRGAGKSTFLKTAYDALPCGQNGKEYQVENLAQLAYIDPSRIENNEIILLGILKSLAEKIECKRRQTSCLEDESNDKIFRESFKKIAGGLSLFAKDHHPLQNLDPELFLDYGLERAGHSKDLRRHLHKLFDIACTLLGADALLLAFDDADTNSQHSRALLECIRNYLDTPRLLILVTGDMELYSLLVRDHFFDNLRHSQYDKDEERHQQRVRMVDHLEDQYLLKLFPIHRRVQLLPLWNLLEDGSNDYRLEHFSWQEPRKPIEVINEIIRGGLRIKGNADIILYREFLLKQPLRSILQILSHCAVYVKKTDTEGMKNNTWAPVFLGALRECLHSIALGSLYKFGVNLDSIYAHELPALIEAVFDLSVRDGDLDTAAYLRPRPGDSDLKNSFAALAADVAGLCGTKPATLIQYLLAGPGSTSLFGLARPRMEKEDSAEEKRRKFKQYMAIGRKEDALNWARHATAMIAAPHGANPSRPLVDFGVIGLNKSKPSAVDERGESFKTISQAIAGCVSLPTFTLTLVDVSGSSNRTYASIYNMLGVISRLLQGDSSFLKNLYPPLSISRSGWEGGGQILEDDIDDFTTNDDNGNKNFRPEFYASIASWIKYADKNSIQFTPSSILLGKIWNRLYFSLEKVSDTLRPKKEIGPASLMQMFAFCVINAFLVEETDHHLITTDDIPMQDRPDRNNPLTSPEAFLGKLDKVAKYYKKLPLTHLIATCPIILGLMEDTERTRKSVKILLTPVMDIYASMPEVLLCHKGAWDLIEKSFIAGRWKKND